MNFKFKVLGAKKGFVFGQELPTTMVRRIVFELRNII
jgi:hypothetical protein